jgi:hypothetical protein
VCSGLHTVSFHRPARAPKARPNGARPHRCSGAPTSARVVLHPEGMTECRSLRRVSLARRARPRLGGLAWIALALPASACCSETDFDFAIERAEGSNATCAAVCQPYLDAAEREDVTFELRGCSRDETEDQRDLVVCYVTEINCVPNNHF